MTTVDIRSIVGEARRQGIVFSVSGTDLVMRRTRGAIVGELEDLIVASKDEIITYLLQRARGVEIKAA